MTKQEIINYILNTDFTDIQNRLDALMNQDRITSGARYYVYNPYNFYGFNQIMKILDKASKSRNYSRYLNRVSSIAYNIYLDDFRENMTRTLAFIQEQETLPFVETQKQVLISKGEIKYE